MKESYIPSDGIRLHAKLDTPEGFSKGPLVLLIHGFTGHMEEEHIIAAQQVMNEIGYAVLRVEMYGHGGSEGAFKDHTLYKWIGNALDVVDYVKTLDWVTDLYLCGHSQGGLLVMMIAGMRPDDFKAVIPLAPAWMIPEKARTGDLLGIPFDPLHIPEELDTGEINGNLILGGNYIRTAQTLHPEDEIARYRGPVLIVQGDEDEAVPLEYAEKAAELYENCRLVIIPGDSHCYDHHLDIMVDAVRNFLTGLQ
ncbi:MAG: alpha/beta fold hydrolase [Lachnospiraceae bacterium]|nr:alpha/beta fold hydrolase [Lachnospiraceae bacterium]